MYDEKGVLLQNIVGAEYIVSTHWLNIVGAAAPTAPMVPTPMLILDIMGLLIFICVLDLFYASAFVCFIEDCKNQMSHGVPIIQTDVGKMG